MKLITRDTDYALRAVCYIAKKKGRIVDARELEAKLKVPRSFLRKILQLLNKRGILKSQKGTHGGFTMALSVKKIFLFDLIRIFQGQLKLNECFLGKNACPNKNKCALRKVILGIESMALERLKRIKIDSLLS